jgi:hypothetical protein
VEPPSPSRHYFSMRQNHRTRCLTGRTRLRIPTVAVGAISNGCHTACVRFSHGDAGKRGLGHQVGVPIERDGPVDQPTEVSIDDGAQAAGSAGTGGRVTQAAAGG